MPISHPAVWVRQSVFASKRRRDCTDKFCEAVGTIRREATDYRQRCIGTDELAADLMRSQELTMTKPTIAVFGGTGRQGGGVIDALLASGQFSVRVASRSPGSDAAKALARRGVDVAKADLLDAASLHPLLQGAYGVFVVTNFWDPAQMHRETEIGGAAVREARSAGVKHLV